MYSLRQNQIAWSRTGIIAYGDSESSEGNLCITFLETVNGSNWRFHPPQRYIIHPQLHEIPTSQGSVGGSNINVGIASPTTVPSASTHVRPNIHFFYNISSIHWNDYFSLPGDMLTVCDEIGNVTMMITGQGLEGATTFEKLTLLFQDNIYKMHNHAMPLSPVNQLQNTLLEKKQTKKEYNTTILDFHWISSSKAIIGSQFCVFDSSVKCYRNKAQQVSPFGVFYPPFMKYACLGIRRNGQIDFWYQFSNSKDHKKITLQLFYSQDQRSKELDWFEFAKLTPINEEQALLITTYSKLSKKLSFYKLNVSWNAPADKSENLLNDPTLSVKLILESNVERVDSEGNIIELMNIHPLFKSPLIKEPSPEILLIYRVCGTNKSIIRRQKITHIDLSTEYLSILKPDLPSTQSGKGGFLKSERYSISQSGELKLDNIVVHVTSELIDGFITFYFENGSVATYNQNDWILETERSKKTTGSSNFSNVIMSILSSGFHYPALPPSGVIEWMTVSPSMAGIITKIVKDPVPKFFPVYQNDVLSKANDNINAVAFAFSFANITHRQLASEDLTIACKTHILKIAKLDVKRAEDFIVILMSNLFSFFNVSPDAPKDIMDKMIMSRPIQKIMLLQLELGSGFGDESIAKIARVILYLKNILFALSGVSRNLQFAVEQMNNSSNSTKSIFPASFSKQDLIHSIIPIAKWFVKFTTYLIQEVLLLINNPLDIGPTLVLGIFGAKMPRHLILTILSEIKKIIQLITKFPENTYPVLNESSHFLKMVLSESPVNFEKFETFLVDVNNKFTALNEQQVPNARETSLAREYSLLIRGVVPTDQSKITEFLLNYSRNAIISRVNAANIFFSDTSGLSISNDELFVPKLHHLLKPIADGLIIEPQDLPAGMKSSRKFSQTAFDGITYDYFSQLEMQTGKLKRCSRCGCVTRAGYVISPDKTIVATSIQTRRWPTMYTRNCVCSGMLYDLESETNSST
ncbi:hypothetical protein KAFR_0A08020 [Kazachstania africana CBS 2517]|uniref:Mediator of RNA polymerase II transcription subunit 16 n=1 Tax=Kazachstania africana (strain ATCC 22294 / BCRC 22015 / CBS 2517 / CECT 1963 / NBRC 1671 / NRRL Y-8276) TaxID=1071382 RepID=H2APD6_KAZAF|nr:hypothetical protein KAFR_0A08020 [Kazachstania africana CBS 2517]CCF56236.1 hypothetical protein KAFR_0A08020 [Kazachstania africana CBS 2517]